MPSAEHQVVEKIAGSTVRHSITSAGATLVTAGVLSPEVVMQFADASAAVVVGLGVFALGFVLSLIEKFKR